MCARSMSAEGRGLVTVYPIPASAARPAKPQDIVVVEAREVWFTDETTNAASKLDPRTTSSGGLLIDRSGAGRGELGRGADRSDREALLAAVEAGAGRGELGRRADGGTVRTITAPSFACLTRGDSWTGHVGIRHRAGPVDGAIPGRGSLSGHEFPRCGRWIVPVACRGSGLGTGAPRRAPRTRRRRR